MKKFIVAITLIIGLAMVSAASAQWGRGGRGYGGCGNCPQVGGPMAGQMMAPLDAATQEKLNQFYKDTQELHKQMAMKQAERQAVMRADNPNPQAAAKIAGEMFDLRTAIHDKAAAAGVEQYLGRGGKGRGWRGAGPCLGMGPGMMNTPPALDAPQQ